MEENKNGVSVIWMDGYAVRSAVLLAWLADYLNGGNAVGCVNSRVGVKNGAWE